MGYAAGLEKVIVKVGSRAYLFDAAVKASGNPQTGTTNVLDYQAVNTGSLIQELALEANALSVPILTALTGQETHYNSQGAEVFSAGTTAGTNPPYFECTAISKAKDEDGNSVKLVSTWYKCKVKHVHPVQAGGSVFKVSIKATAYPTNVTVGGTALDSWRISDVYMGDFDDSDTVYNRSIVNLSGLTRQQVVASIAQQSLEVDGYNETVILRPDILFVVDGVLTSVSDGTLYQTGDTVQGERQQAELTFSALYEGQND